MPDTPLVDAAFLTKLGLKPEQRLRLVRAPEAWVRALSLLTPVNGRSISKAGVILVWLQPKDDLRKVFDRLEAAIPPDGAIWAVIPKKSALTKGEAGVEWAAMQAAGLASGRLVDNKELRFDDRYYGTRFVVRKERR